MAPKLPHETETKFLIWAGTGTDLIFNRNIELPGFASFPLLERAETRAVLKDQMVELTGLASKMGLASIVDAPTWMANAKRAAALGYDATQLDAINQDAVALMCEVRDEAAGDVLVSACIGPARDPYTQEPPMTVEEAHAYHQPQVNSVKTAGADLATAYTFNQASEAAGVARAAKQAGLPLIVSFVVETDGNLNNGQRLDDAISEVDALTEASPIFYMVNCAHPSHFRSSLTDNPRLRGVVVNASRCSHEELDEADALDAGDPEELGREVAELFAFHPAMTVFGGCCGTDMRHLSEMARRVVT